VVTEQKSGFAGFVVVLVFMKSAAEIERPGLSEQELTAHLWGFYTNGWRLTLASTEVAYPSLVPETGKPSGDQGRLNQLAVKKRFQPECSVPCFFRELFPFDFRAKREAVARCCGVVLSF
jgi:hypothetical protein